MLFIRGQFRLLRGIDRSHALYDLRVAVEGGLIAQIVAAMFIDAFTYKYVWATFFLLAQVRAVYLRGVTVRLDLPERSAPATGSYFARVPQSQP